MESGDQFDLFKMIDMAKQISEWTGHISIELFTNYLEQYVLLLKSMGKIVEIGFADLTAKISILRNNKIKLENAGIPISTLEEIIEQEMKLGLSQLNGNNNLK